MKYNRLCLTGKRYHSLLYLVLSTKRLLYFQHLFLLFSVWRSFVWRKAFARFKGRNVPLTYRADPLRVVKTGIDMLRWSWSYKGMYLLNVTNLFEIRTRLYDISSYAVIHCTRTSKFIEPAIHKLSFIQVIVRFDVV